MLISYNPKVAASVVGNAQAVVSAATPLGVASTLVKRDGLGGFSAGAIIASSLESSGSTLNIASTNTTQVVNLGSGSTVQTINVGNSGVGATTINLGGGTDSVNITKAYIANSLSFPIGDVRKRIAVFDDANPADTADHRFNGFGKGSYVQVYQIKTTAENHVFYAATSATTSNELFRIAGSGAISCTGSMTTGSLIAPSITFPSGTLSYYEEYDHTTTFNLAAATPVTSLAVTIRFTRIGRQVTAHVPAVVMTNTATLSVAASLSSVTAFPSRFRSSNSCYSFVSVNNDQFNPASFAGCVGVTSAGQFEVHPTTAISNYSVNGAYNFGFSSFSSTWTT